MPTPPVSKQELIKSVGVVKQHGGNLSAAAHTLEIARSTLQNRLATVENKQVVPGFKATDA